MRPSCSLLVHLVIVLRLAVCAALISLSTAAAAQAAFELSPSQSWPPRRILLDTDLFSDVDDAGALLLLLTNPDIQTLAVSLSHPSRYSALAAAGIVDYYSTCTTAVTPRPQHNGHGNNNIPLGLPLVRWPGEATGKLTDEAFLDRYYFRFGEYASKVAYRWVRGSPAVAAPSSSNDEIDGSAGSGLGWDDIAADGTVRDGGERWGDAVAVYRRVLARVLGEAEVADREGDEWKVTVVVIGFLDNVCSEDPTPLSPAHSTRRQTSWAWNLERMLD